MLYLLVDNKPIIEYCIMGKKIDLIRDLSYLSMWWVVQFLIYAYEEKKIIGRGTLCAEKILMWRLITVKRGRNFISIS